MKKIVKMLVIGVALTSLAACSASESGTNAKNAANKESSTEQKSESSSTTASSEITFAEESVSPEGANSNSSIFDYMIRAAQTQLPMMKEQFSGVYSNIEILAGEDHTIVYKFTFAEDDGLIMDAAALKPVMVEQMKPIMDSVNGMIPDAKIQVIYLRPDLTELGNIMITQEDTNAIPSEEDPI
ncbi:hypothetical protein [Enterococcus sp. DIV0170]|uniref:hypothetical protein n=1 Tax=Enterococcus sp. DIV0170 TaxID=2774642 RepID=UPI003F2513A9